VSLKARLFGGVGSNPTAATKLLALVLYGPDFASGCFRGYRGELGWMRCVCDCVNVCVFFTLHTLFFFVCFCSLS
jgi:hypothetical protein